jgi:DNA polymerase III subunit epsilon
MAQETTSVPQQGVLLRRAHELLESSGHPVSEDALLAHLFGVSDGAQANAIWTTLLRRTLTSSSLFEECADACNEEGSTRAWALTAWRSTQKTLDEIEFVILDTETTGLRPGHHRVIEVAGIRMRGGEVLDSFQTLLNPGVRLPNFIVQFTGITQEMVATAPRAAEALPDFFQFIDGAILVGHNVGFDIGFLSYEAQLLGYTFPIDGLDTIPLARRFLPALKRFKLDRVAEHLKIPASNRHRALGDAKVTAAVFIKLLDLACQQGITTLGHLRRRLQLPVAWSGDISEATTSKQLELLRADGRVANQSAALRPTGTLFITPAW